MNTETEYSQSTHTHTLKTDSGPVSNEHRDRVQSVDAHTYTENGLKEHQRKTIPNPEDL